MVDLVLYLAQMADMVLSARVLLMVLQALMALLAMVRMDLVVRRHLQHCVDIGLARYVCPA